MMTDTDIWYLLTQLPHRNEPERWQALTNEDHTLIDHLRYDQKPATARDIEQLQALCQRLGVAL